jgi:hypothetical protein
MRRITLALLCGLALALTLLSGCGGGLGTKNWYYHESNGPPRSVWASDEPILGGPSFSGAMED